MKHYQLHGLAFLSHMQSNGMPAILGDEMGLGKTLETLALFAHMKEQCKKGEVCTPHLIVAPMSVMASWATEIARWLPEFTFIKFHGQRSERERLKRVAKETSLDICITSYEQFTAEEVWFKNQIAWVYVVLDEG